MKPDLILITNASETRLLRREHGNLLGVLESFEHPESRSKVSDQVDDKMASRGRVHRRRGQKDQEVMRLPSMKG